VAEAGGISKAAGSDPAKQSLFSRQIRELEAFFQAELTVRRGKRIALTVAGEELARLAREHFRGLDDFFHRCRSLPQKLSIAAGNSTLEWGLLLHIQRLQAALPVGTQVELFNQRTAEIVAGLTGMTTDVAIVRTDAIVGLKTLRNRRIGELSYALYVPARLAKGLNAKNLQSRLAEIPLATSAGGQFRESLEAEARRSNWTLRVELSCASFTQAARAAVSGAYAAILPTLARAEMLEVGAAEIALPFLKKYVRTLCVAWNPRLAEVRPLLKTALGALAEVLSTA
jgi:DNA-binding transcriptional LysR family regulator